VPSPPNCPFGRFHCFWIRDFVFLPEEASMKRYVSHLGFAIVSLACLIVLAACSSGSPTLRYVAITPQTASIAVATTQQFTAQAFYSDGTTKDATMLATWASSNTSVATITPAGLATAGTTAGSSTISATYLGASATAALTVTQPYTAIVVSCTPASVALGLTSNCTATGNPGAVDISTSVSWSSSSPTVATIPMSAPASPAVATGVLQGSTNISATLGALTSNNFSLTVTGPVANGLTVTPGTPTAAKGNTVPFIATEHFSDGTSGHPLTGTVTWQSATTTVATIVSTSINGSASATVLASSGSSVITATEGTLTGTATLTAAAPVAHYAYVGNINDNNISGFSVTASSATLTPLAASTGNPWTCATGPQQVIVHPSGKYLYALCAMGASATTATTFDILDPTTGALSTPTSTPASGFSFSSTVGTGAYNKGVIDPTGQFLFVLDFNTTTKAVAGYTINQADGSVSTTAINSLATGDAPTDIMIAQNATGTYLYVSNSGLGTAGSPASVSGYSIDATGTLTALNSGTPFPNGVSNVTSFGLYGTVDPSSSFLYVVNTAPDNDVTVFSVAANGTLSPITGSPFVITGATSLASVAVDPTDKYLYAVDSNAPTGNVYAYNIVTGGGISATPAITGSPFATGLTPVGISIDPSGTFLAVVNNATPSTISLFKLAPSTGVLTPGSPATATVGNVAQYLTFWVGP
jgi:6-phosphogluconolactonase (cycloisomerase 2 family)